MSKLSNFLATTLISASVFCSIQSFANADDDKTLAFARNGFATLFSMPRPQNEVDQSAGLFTTPQAFADFVQSTRNTAWSGLSNAKGITVSYSFPDVSAWAMGLTLPKGQAMVRFAALQSVTVGTQVSQSCFDVETYIPAESVELMRDGYLFDKLIVHPAAMDYCHAKPAAVAVAANPEKHGPTLEQVANRMEREQSAALSFFGPASIAVLLIIALIIASRRIRKTKEEDNTPKFADD